MSLLTFIDEVSDPVLALDGDEICALNEAAIEAFAVSETLAGSPVTELFCYDAELASSYDDALSHYSDVGGVIDDGRRHFDSTHPTIATLRNGRQSLPDPDVGLFVDGQLRYYHLRSSPTDIDDVEQLVTFRDVTRLKGRERDLTFLKEVLTRILRHNLRNELTVIQGNAQTIADVASQPGPELATEMLESCTSLMETSEKARAIQSAIEADEQVPFHLPKLVTDVVTNYENRADTSVDVPDITVLANPSLPEAVGEIVENCVVHTESTPTITITCERDGPWATLVIADDGPGIPDRELDIFEQRGESRLVHGTGAGLWLVYTVIQESDGDLVYDTSGEGTTVRMQLPLADGSQNV